MELRSRLEGAVTVVSPQGRIDLERAPLFEKALAPILEECKPGQRSVLLDFSGVDYVSSVGLRALMIAARRVAAQKGRIAVAGLQPLVREVFEISRFHLVFKL